MKSIKWFALAVLFVSFMSCKSTNGSESTDSASKAVENTTTAAKNTDVKKDDAAPTGPTTTIEFAESTYDFGTVKDGEKVTHNYKFKNTGSEPLVISNAKGSCGCTVPDWPREPVAPGAEGVIKVVFNSKNKGSVEGRKQTKRVTLTANTDPTNTFLTITGIVKKDADAAAKK